MVERLEAPHGKIRLKIIDHGKDITLEFDDVEWFEVWVQREGGPFHGTYQLRADEGDFREHGRGRRPEP